MTKPTLKIGDVTMLVAGDPELIGYAGVVVNIGPFNRFRESLQDKVKWCPIHEDLNDVGVTYVRKDDLVTLGNIDEILRKGVDMNGNSERQDEGI